MRDRAKVVFDALEKSSYWENIEDGIVHNLLPVVRAVTAKNKVKCTFTFGIGFYVEANKRIKGYINALPISELFSNQS